jgi:hypothetical protein
VITEIQLANYRCHRDLVVDVKPFTLLVGGNGCGKTAVLEAMHLASQLWYKPPSEVFQSVRSLDALTRQGQDGDPSMGIYVKGIHCGQKKALHFHTGMVNRSNERFMTMTMNGVLADRTTQSFRDSFPTEEWHSIHRSALFHIDDPNQATTFSEADKFARVRYDGYRTSTVLANLRLADEDSFDAITRDLHRIFPWVHRIRLLPSNARSEPGSRAISQGGYQVTFDVEGATGVSGPGVGKGVPTVLALLTAIHSPDSRPHFAMIDDLDKHLEPALFARFIEVIGGIIRDSRTGHYPLQVLATAYTAPLAPWLANSQVFCVVRMDDMKITDRK